MFSTTKSRVYIEIGTGLTSARIHTDIIAETCKDTAQAPFFVSLVGNVGDGNFHLGMMIDPDDPEEWLMATAINDRMVHRATALGGPSTGEHGVGLGKKKSTHAEHGEAVDVMWRIKKALDPAGILNPGKVLPEE